jgi:hypothetical protein
MTILTTIRRLPRRLHVGLEGSSMTEFALMAPFLSVIVLWTIYFWEMSHAKIKAAEAARFVAWERASRPAGQNSQIGQDAIDRFKDLESHNKGVAQSDGWSQATQQGGIGGIMGQATALVGNAVQSVLSYFGFDTSKGAARADIEFKMQNKVIPEKLGPWELGFANGGLDLTFKESYYLYVDTWRAWKWGNNPSNTYSLVQNNVYDKVKGVAYLGLMNGAGAGVLNTIGEFLSWFNLDFPLSTSYIRDSVLIKKVTEPGRFPGYLSDNRTTPGDKLKAWYWKNENQYCMNSCEPQSIWYKRGERNHTGLDNQDNWPMRAYNCRGKFFQGAIKNDKLEVEYCKSVSLGKQHFNMGSNACVQ